MGAVAELAASQHGVLTRTQAAALGLSARHLRTQAALALLDEPVRGVLRVRAAPTTWHQQQLVATLAPPGFHAAFRGAAFLHHYDGVRQPCPEVIGPRGCRRIDGIDVIQHWVEPLDAEDLVTVDGISCTGLARTLVDLCGLGDRDLAQRAFDDFERRAVSLNWLRLTAQRLHRPGQAGTGVVFELLDRRQRGGRVPDSWFERLVERCLRMPGLPPWERQHEVRDPTGELIGRLDLACPALLLGVEANSKQFHHGVGPERLDQRRDNLLATLGWDLTYVGWYDTEQPAVVARTIESIARRRAALLGVTLPWRPDRESAVKIDAK
jgi:hypothetical protein